MSDGTARSPITTRFFFVHVQKTAGTALWRRLKQQFDPQSVYPGPGDGDPPDSVLSVEHLLERWRVRRDEIVVVTGHFPLCTIERMDARFTTLTLLRDPVERTLSALRDQRERSPELGGSSLEVIYEDPRRRALLRNHMVRMFALNTEEMTNGAFSEVELTRSHLERAQDKLTRVDVVGFQDQFDDFCDELTERFGWDLGPPIFMNRTQPLAASQSMRSRIAEDNALDVELYDFARRTRARTRP